MILFISLLNYMQFEYLCQIKRGGLPPPPVLCRWAGTSHRSQSTHGAGAHCLFQYSNLVLRAEILYSYASHPVTA